MNEPMEPSRTAIPRRAFLAYLSAVALAANTVLRRDSASAQPAPPPSEADTDPYARYIRTSRDFRRVKQDKTWLDKAFPGWIYMPWTYQWTIGYTEASGKWSLAHGYNGAFLDGNGGQPDSPEGKLAWINRFGLRFYLDHTARKGYLHLWDGDKQQAHLAELHGTGVRPVPINDALREKLRGFIRDNIAQVKSSPYRAAYALDDETSWGHFVHPTTWRVTDDETAYPRWLREIYGAEAAPQRERWFTYEDIRPHLAEWSVREFDASPLMDQWTFNDSIWCNLLGDLVEFANSVDPETPCGIVGGQAPNAFGGYDYARLMRKLQYIEAYNLASSQAIVRSFNPGNAVPAVTSMFHRSAADDIWQTWYYLAHGNRGHIGWVENWFDGQTPRPWHEQVAPHYLEAGKKIGPLMLGAEWMHDGIALLYNHPSLQLGWILDAQAHGTTWVNRESDHRLGASHLVRQAWENMLRDSGLQYNWISYVDVIQNGVPAVYHTLILPTCLCLSEAEAGAIEAFCKAGGTVIADYLPGVWDQHGRGRAAGGALDRMFGVRHDPALTAKDVFGGKLWCEVDQDANYGWKTYHEFLTNGNTCIQDTSGFNKAVRNMPVGNVNRYGSGTAVLMNLSPQWYNAYRMTGFEAAKRRDTFLRHVGAGKARRWVEIEGAGEAEFGYEITYWRRPDGRRLLFLCSNPETVGSELGGGNAVGLKTDAIAVTLKFAQPVRNVRDERKGRHLGSGARFALTWPRNEALVLSLDDPAGERATQRSRN
ncbi:MAG TPA: beta-galactosidase trimerization domain-containing protein [Chthonomonadaceae bacterium]|nr:beta-galactosidase trimerization domain-containing protein [Chthonomonadaceae bacterium]